MATTPTAAQQRIVDIFEAVEREFPDKTMAWIITLTCDRYEHETGIEIDHPHVTDAINAVNGAPGDDAA